MTVETQWLVRTEPVEQRVGLCDGTELGYAASWSELSVGCAEGEGVNSLGEGVNSLSATSYTVDLPGRPITFLWNGGPGASSTPLHFSAFGPRLQRDGALVDNPDTLLAASDLVFIDPVGTGFSRLAGDTWLSVEADAEAIAAFIRQFLTAVGREQERIFLVGESYGGYRLAAVLPLLDGVDVAGMAFVSPALDMTTRFAGGGADQLAVFELPTMVVAAAAHGAASPTLDPAAAWAAAQRFAVEELAPALYWGEALDSERRARLRARIGEFTGLPADTVPLDLRLSSETFLRTLKRPEGLLVGRLDVRVTGPLTEVKEGRAPAADDPALGMRGRNVIVSALAGDYLRDVLQVPVDRDYVALSLELNFQWDWRPRGRELQAAAPPAAHVGAYVTAHPGCGVLLLGGYFDLATPLAASIYTLRHCGLPQSALTVVPLAGGHSLDAATRPIARQAVVALLERPATLGATDSPIDPK